MPKYLILSILIISNILFMNIRAHSQDIDDKISLLEDFLNKLDNVSMIFEQKSFDGKIDVGWMVIKKPHNIRIEYEKPNPVIIVSNKDYLVLYNADDDIITHIPINDGPWKIFASKNIRLSSELKDKFSHGFVKNIEEIEHKGKIYYFYKILIRGNQNFLKNEIILHMETNPYRITGWRIITENNKEIYVRIAEIKKESLSPNSLELFKISEKEKASGDVWKGPFNRSPAKRYPKERF